MTSEWWASFRQCQGREGWNGPAWKWPTGSHPRRRFSFMDCLLCGRSVTVEHLEIKPAVVHCKDCVAHKRGEHSPMCAACRIEALPGFSMGSVRRLTSDEMLSTMWHFGRHDVVWRSVDGGLLVVVAPDSPAYGLTVDATGWCKRRQ